MTPLLPPLDLVYYGSGNPGPWNPEQRPGDNKWTCGMFARKPAPARPCGPISGAQGALITFAPHLWYPIYGARTAAWGLNAIEDQQLAGLIMWIPAGVLFTILGIALFAAWLGEAERRVALGSSDALRKEQS